MSIVKFTRRISDQSYFSYYEKSLYCDVNLCSGGMFIPVHKIVLSAASLFFSKLFEEQTDGQLTANVPLKFNILREVLELIYMGEVVVPLEDTLDVVAAIEFLNISGVEGISKELRTQSEEEIEEECIDMLRFLATEILDFDDVKSPPLKRKNVDVAVNGKRMKLEGDIVRCKFCNKKRSKGWLGSHEKSCIRNPNRIIYACKSCGTDYTSRNGLTTHQKKFKGACSQPASHKA